MGNKENKELGKMVKESVEGTTDELIERIPHIDLSPEISDAKIKKAVLDISEEGMNKLFQRFGKENVMTFLSEFSQGKEW